MPIPGASVEIGSDEREIDACVRFWSPRLTDASDRPLFRDWIEKESPRHSVDIAPFLISRFPVTNMEYRLYVDSTVGPVPPSIPAGAPHDHPVWGLTYDDAVAYASWLGTRLGAPLRLPTEAEWEYAARGATRTEFPWGDEFDPTCCNTLESGIRTTTAVDAYPGGRSELDVWDLSGNVEEWTSTFYAPYPGGRFVNDDIAEGAEGRYRVLRGGSCVLGGDLARCARRHGPFTGRALRYVGFRLVWEENRSGGAAA